MEVECRYVGNEFQTKGDAMWYRALPANLSPGQRDEQVVMFS